MNVERLGSIRIGSGDYARRMLETATEKGWHVRLLRDREKYIQRFGGIDASEKGFSSWLRRRFSLPRRVDKELQQGEKVGMAFYRPISEKAVSR